MEESEMVKLALIAIDKKMEFEDFYYSDYMYGKESFTENVWDYVEECEEIGTIAFREKYNIK